MMFFFPYQALRQWWEMKAQHFDCVLFFKVGKFYELFHMDAVISVNELQLQYMRVSIFLSNVYSRMFILI